jgi:hypothetical protein
MILFLMILMIPLTYWFIEAGISLNRDAAKGRL